MDRSQAWLRAGADDLTLDEALELARFSEASLSVLAQNGSAPRESLEWIYQNCPRYALDVCLNINAPPEMKLSVPFRMHSHAAVMQCLEDLGCGESDVAAFFRLAQNEPASPLRGIFQSVGIGIDDRANPEPA